MSKLLEEYKKHAEFLAKPLHYMKVDEKRYYGKENYSRNTGKISKQWIMCYDETSGFLTVKEAVIDFFIFQVTKENPFSLRSEYAGAFFEVVKKMYPKVVLNSILISKKIL